MVLNIPEPFRTISEVEPVARPPAPVQVPGNVIFNVGGQVVGNTNTTTTTAANANVQTVNRTSKVCASMIFAFAVCLIVAALYMIMFLKNLVFIAIMLITGACVLILMVACGLWCISLGCCKGLCSWFTKTSEPQPEPQPSETTPLLPPADHPNYHTPPNTPTFQHLALQAQALHLQQEASTLTQPEPETPAQSHVAKEPSTLDQPDLETPALQHLSKEPPTLDQLDLETLAQSDLETAALQQSDMESSTDI